jgi:hypothetical protein
VAVLVATGCAKKPALDEAGRIKRFSELSVKRARDGIVAMQKVIDAIDPKRCETGDTALAILRSAIAERVVTDRDLTAAAEACSAREQRRAWRAALKELKPDQDAWERLNDTRNAFLRTFREACSKQADALRAPAREFATNMDGVYELLKPRDFTMANGQLGCLHFTPPNGWRARHLDDDPQTQGWVYASSEEDPYDHQPMEWLVFANRIESSLRADEWVEHVSKPWRTEPDVEVQVATVQVPGSEDGRLVTTRTPMEDGVIHRRRWLVAIHANTAYRMSATYGVDDADEDAMALIESARIECSETDGI